MRGAGPPAISMPHSPEAERVKDTIAPVCKCPRSTRAPCCPNAAGAGGHRSMRKQATTVRDLRISLIAGLVEMNECSCICLSPQTVVASKVVAIGPNPSTPVSRADCHLSGRANCRFERARPAIRLCYTGLPPDSTAMHTGLLWDSAPALDETTTVSPKTWASAQYHLWSSPAIENSSGLSPLITRPPSA